jgi:hypothetical protein
MFLTWKPPNKHH